MDHKENQNREAAEGMTLAPEEEAILLLSRLDPGETDHSRAISLMENDSPFDADRMIHLATHNGVAPLLQRNLRETGLPAPGAARRLKNIYLATVARNTINAGETMRLLRLLGGKGIEAVPLKGAVASETIFRDPGLYPAGDIDLLVRPADIERARDLILEEGYSIDRGRERDMTASHYHIVLWKDHHFVELHWNLTKRYFKTPPEFWWEETRREELHGEEIICLSPERYLLYTIFRLFSHDFLHLKFFVLPAELVNLHGRRMRWDQLMDHAARYRMTRLTSFTLKLLRDLLGARVPDDVASGKLFMGAYLGKRVARGLFRESGRPYTRRVIHLLLLDSPLDALRGLAGRFFPNRGELRLRYGIPEGSGRIYLYYLLNLVLLPRLIFRKRN